VRSQFAKSGQIKAAPSRLWRPVNAPPTPTAQLTSSSYGDEAKAYLLSCSTKRSTPAPPLCLDMSVRFVPRI
jgi:hypothetical protein